MSHKTLNRQDRRALLDRIAAKKMQKPPPSAFRNLEDSDEGSDEELSFATARSKPSVTLLDSSEEENQGPRVGIPRRAAPAGSKLNRLRKAGAVPLPPNQPQQQQQQWAAAMALEDDGDDVIAAQLGGLSIKGKPGCSEHRCTGNSTAAAPVPPTRPRLDLARSQYTLPAACREERAEAAEQDSRCLVLGEHGEFQLNVKVSTMLYPHQVEGIKWLWSLHRLNRGGILADDMGLGKTIQCTAFLAGLIQGRHIRRAIVVAPKTLLAQWRKELGVCGLQAQAHEYGGSAAEREAALRSVVCRPGVLLTTYGMMLHNAKMLAQHSDHDPDEGPMWDVVICDEGHKLKNPRMQLRKAVDELPAGMRVIISGTPIQNNMMEMWALFNFCAPDVLGAAPDFRERYEKVIMVGSDKHATKYEREQGAVAAAHLRQEIGPYMLRREKKEVFKSADGDAAVSGSDTTAVAADAPANTTAAEAVAGSGGAKPSAMPHKNDLIVWLKLKPMQRRVYQAFLNSDSVKKVFNQTASALAAITVLKKVCDHPALLSERAAHGIVSGVNRARRQAATALGGGSDVEEDEDSSEEEQDLLNSEEGEWESDSEDYSSNEEWRRQHHRQQQHQKQLAKKVYAKKAGGLAAVAGAVNEEEWSLWTSADIEERLLEEVHTTDFAASCKTVFVMALLKNLVAEGHRTLIFSQSRVMLNILESAIKDERWHYCRIDGSVASTAERQARVHQFQTSASIPIFLLTSQVGGLGLTLTAADRVIILDPAWNPSTDNQSVDRAYRIGQRRDVVVYRLISCGTVEEKIYRRQVFKGGLSRTGMEEGEQLRYFAAQDLSDLFQLDPGECEASRTQRELHDMHAAQRRETPALTRHLAFLRTLDCYAGVSDHDLLFSIKAKETLPAASITRTAATNHPGCPSDSVTAGAPGGGSPQKQGSGRTGSVFGKTATQGWSGGSGLSELFAKAVAISAPGSSAAVAAAAQPPCSSKALLPPQALPQQTLRITMQERIADLEGMLERKRNLLSLSSGLADGGARVRIQIAELEKELVAVKQEAALAALPPAAPVHAGPPAQLAPGTGAWQAAGAVPGGVAAAPPAKPSSGSSLVAAAVAAPLPSSGRLIVTAQQPTVHMHPTRSAAPLAASTADSVPSTKPPASPLFTRLRDMLFGGGGSSKRPAVDAASAVAQATSDGGAGSNGGGRTLFSSGMTGAAADSAQVVQLKQPSAGSTNDLSAGELLTGAWPPASRDGAGQSSSSDRVAEAAVAQAPAVPGAASSDAQAAKPQRTRKEVKARLMDTLQAIKAEESGGYFDREKVDKLRRRAARLAQQYEELKQIGVTRLAALQHERKHPGS